MSDSLPWASCAVRLSREVRVGIVGDLILDEYLEGEVTRISPEAPIPVQRVTNTFHSAGGAANVARNVALSGGKPLLFGVTGEDEAAKQLRAILSADEISAKGLFALGSRSTTRKTRVTASHQQLVRIDWEHVDDISADAQEWFMEAIAAADMDVLILSDYGKGVLTDDLTRRLLAAAAVRGIPTIVDPKGKSYERYRRAYLITPNHKEAVEALATPEAPRLDDLDLASALRAKYEIAHVLVTLGAKGMILVTAGEHFYLPAEAREVFDVSGAGDTVVAMMALGIGAGLDIPGAMRIANVAAGIVVEKWGTQPVTSAELSERLARGEAARSGTARAAMPVVVDVERFDEAVLDQLEALASRHGPMVVKVVRRLRESDWQHQWKQRLIGALSCVDSVLSDGDTMTDAATIIADDGAREPRHYRDDRGTIPSEQPT